MEISGIGNGMNTVALSAQRSVSSEEALEIKTGTTEESGKAQQAMKAAEMNRGLGNRIDVTA